MKWLKLLKNYKTFFRRKINHRRKTRSMPLLCGLLSSTKPSNSISNYLKLVEITKSLADWLKRVTALITTTSWTKSTPLRLNGSDTAICWWTTLLFVLKRCSKAVLPDAASRRNQIYRNWVFKKLNRATKHSHQSVMLMRQFI